MEWQLTWRETPPTGREHGAVEAGNVGGPRNRRAWRCRGWRCRNRHPRGSPRDCCSLSVRRVGSLRRDKGIIQPVPPRLGCGLGAWGPCVGRLILWMRGLRPLQSRLSRTLTDPSKLRPRRLGRRTLIHSIGARVLSLTERSPRRGSGVSEQVEGLTDGGDVGPAGLPRCRTAAMPARFAFSRSGTSSAAACPRGGARVGSGVSRPVVARHRVHGPTLTTCGTQRARISSPGPAALPGGTSHHATIEPARPGSRPTTDHRHARHCLAGPP